jgi:hypothetical protein
LDKYNYKWFSNTVGIILILFGFNFITPTFGQNVLSVLWLIDNTNSIGDTTTTKLGDPTVIETELGSAVEFDGIDDGLIVDSNPLAYADSFTIEVIFNPYEASLSTNEEQRFIHIQESSDRRILIELRLTESGEWFLDTFIKDGNSSCVLYASDFLHAINKWYHAALVYKDGIMTHYVNGIFEKTGNVQYSKMTSGQTSIGVRMNQVSWFKGAIRSLRVIHKALEPEDFVINLTDLNENEFRNLKAKSSPEFKLYQNYPNPFNPETTIRYTLSENTNVELIIYDLLGRKVNTLLNENKTAGSYSVTWNARDDQDNRLSGGIYFAQLKTGYMSKSIRLLYLP